MTLWQSFLLVVEVVLVLAHLPVLFTSRALETA